MNSEDNAQDNVQDRAQDKAQELKGKAKEKAGEATNNEQWQVEGKAEQSGSKLKQAVRKAKEAFTRDK